MRDRFSLKVSEKPDGEGFGYLIELSSDGVLSINLHDGMTKLSRDEARELATALLRFADDG